MNQALFCQRVRPILLELEKRCYASRTPLESLLTAPCGYHQWDTVLDDAAPWKPFFAGEAVGGLESHHCFRAAIKLPEEFVGKRAVVLVSTGATDVWNNSNPQFFAYLDGQLVTGLDINHQEVPVSACATPGEEHILGLYLYCNSPQNDVFLTVELAVADSEIQGLYHDIRVAFEVYEELQEESKEALFLHQSLVEAINLLDLRDMESDSFRASIAPARAQLAQTVYAKGRDPLAVQEFCVGHTHIDVAWLWSLAQTREKAIRSFSSVLALMEQYPEYRFMSSQPQLYEYVKNDCPALYQKIREKVAAGVWEIEGGMWVEADCNLTCGESLARQFLYGTAFFREEFQKECRILWLPDVFGYAASLPQIMKLSGIDYFMTTKIAWNDTNQIPADTLYWQGIDGTEVLTHFISTADHVKCPAKNPKPTFNTTYNGILSPSQVLGCWQRYQNKALSRDILQCFGYGDGGGGPTAKMLETQRRMEKAIPGAPVTKMAFAGEFFRQLEETVTTSKTATPKWVGELYLEFHRGTFTSVARNKRYNRKSEFSNMDAEFFSSIAARLGGNYPKQELDHIWKLTLLNQFHDVLPGSSIEQVYIDSKEQYQEILATGKALTHEAISAIGAAVEAPKGGVLVLNPAGFPRSEVVTTKEGALLVQDIPAKGWKLVQNPAYTQAPFGSVSGDCQEIETPFYTLCLNKAGQITRLYDKKAEREVLKQGNVGNLLQLFEDRPANYDAWNLECYYTEKCWPVESDAKILLLECSATAIRVQISHQFGHSKLEQTMVLYPHSRRIDFETTVDWQEEHMLLKVAFPVDVFATAAQFDIQFGNLSRPTHQNTSWDQARFEVCGQKWADLSEPGYGVALLNDCKYGYDVLGNTLRLSLLRAPTHPWPLADREVHQFTYALLPHSGDWRQGNVVNEAYALNWPVHTLTLPAQKGTLPDQGSFVNITGEGIVLETVKQSHDGSGKLVVRAYEAHGCRTSAALVAPKGAVKAYSCNLLEERQEEVPLEEGCATVTFCPYQIRTFLFEF